MTALFTILSKWIIMTLHISPKEIKRKELWSFFCCTFPTTSIIVCVTKGKPKGIFLHITTCLNNKWTEMNKITSNTTRTDSSEDVEYLQMEKGGEYEGVNLRVLSSGRLTSLSLWLSLFHVTAFLVNPSLSRSQRTELPVMCSFSFITASNGHPLLTSPHAPDLYVLSHLSLCGIFLFCHNDFFFFGVVQGQ